MTARPRAAAGARGRGLRLAAVGAIALALAQLAMVIDGLQLTVGGPVTAGVTTWALIAAAITVGALAMMAVGALIALPDDPRDQPARRRTWIAVGAATLAVAATVLALTSDGGRHWWGLSGAPVGPVARAVRWLGPSAIVLAAAALALALMQHADRHADLPVLERARDLSGFLLLQVLIEAVCGGMLGGATSPESFPSAISTMLSLVIGLAVGGYAIVMYARLAGLLRLAAARHAAGAPRP